MPSGGEQQVVDRFGNSGYAVVMFAPEEVQQEIERIRRQLEIPIPMIPAHVTVKGTFIHPPSVEDVSTIVETVAGATRAFTVETGDTRRGGEKAQEQPSSPWAHRVVSTTSIGDCSVR